jgi:hypothetical protein
MNPEQNLKRRNAMKRPKLIQICLLFLLCIGVAGWTTHATGQEKDAAAVTKEMEKTMPLLKGEQWLKIDSNAKRRTD